jgi:arginine repressor
MQPINLQAYITKAEIISRLHRWGVACNDPMIKRQMGKNLNAVKILYEKTNKTDHIPNTSHHVTPRLPRYNCDLSPTECAQIEVNRFMEPNKVGTEFSLNCVN